ncbi:MAG: Crp/Fnr family transcriptional regulator, partial [Polyangiaceae bacterium]
LASDGTPVLLTLAERPQWIGEIALFDGQPRSHDAFAETDAIVIHAPQRAIDAWLERDPRVWRNLGTLLTVKMRLVLLALTDATTLPLGTRLAQRLAHMATGYGDLRIGTLRVVSVSQEQLAAMLWTSRQSVNRALKSLEESGLVSVSYHGIEILDIEGLRTAASCSREH